MLLHLPKEYENLDKLSLSVAKKLSFADPYACAIFQLERMEDIGEAQNFRVEMAKHKCIEYGLLSPIYKEGNRGGCWFCPNVKIKDFAKFKITHPDLWQELIRLSKTPNLCSYGFKYGKTVQEIDERIDAINNQGTLF